MRLLRTYWFPLLLMLATFGFLLADVLPGKHRSAQVLSLHYREDEEWLPPPVHEIPFNEAGELIRYGRELIVHTASFLGPKGLVARVANGMACQNCHIAAGTQNFGNPFSAVASTYPRYRDRSGQIESVSFRVNDCLQRSMNGRPLDTTSPEMQAMVAYILWVGKEVPKTVRPRGAGTGALPYLNRAASPENGRLIFATQCKRCHGENGEGQAATDASEGYVYPPLWGDGSYNSGAGIHRLSSLAGFIKHNMPFGVSWKEPLLTDEEAWDVAAFIASQPRPVKTFAADWKDVSKKPIDYPVGPFADSFSAQQHKYGPFGGMRKK